MSSAFDVESYLLESLDGVRPSAGSELKAKCPECGKTEFYANRISGAFYCFKCRFGGRTIVALVAKLEGFEYWEAAQFCFKKSVKLRRAIPLPALSARIKAMRTGEVAVSGELEKVSAELPEGFRPCFEAGRWALPGYLKQRGLRSRTAREWGLGYCSAGRYAQRLVIPIICPVGKSFTARDMTGNSAIRYLNPSEVDHRRLLIGWNMARTTGDLVICEGPLDAVKLWQHGISAVALGGKVLHDEQLAQLIDLSEDIAITVMLDPEAYEDALAVSARLSTHFKKVYLSSLQSGTDPGSSTIREAHAAIEAATLWKGGSLVALARLARSRAAISSKFERKSLRR